MDNEMAEAAASPQHYKYTLKELSTDSRLLPRWHTEEEKMMVLASFAYEQTSQSSIADVLMVTGLDRQDLLRPIR